MPSGTAFKWAGWFAAALTALGAGPAAAKWDQLNLTPGVTPISREVYDLHMLVLWICVGIGVVVFGVMFFAIWKFRKSTGAKAANFHENTTVEVLWTVVPLLILIAVAVPATRTLIAMENTGDADVSIVATGYQWRWHYEYLNEDVSFFSSLAESSNRARQLDSGISPESVPHYLLDVDNPMVVPVNKKVRLLTTANDVIHSWWVPALGTKRDAIPGFINESWFMAEEPGTYRGQCTELCGKDHGFMPVVVVALAEDDYAQWVSDFKARETAAELAKDPNREWSMSELITAGEPVYATNCSGCHQGDGAGVPGNIPAMADSELATGDSFDLIDMLMYGPGTIEGHAFKDQLDDIALAAVVTYTRNSFGNDLGDAVQPSDVAEFR